MSRLGVNPSRIPTLSEEAVWEKKKGFVDCIREESVSPPKLTFEIIFLNYPFTTTSVLLVVINLVSVTVSASNQKTSYNTACTIRV